MNILFLTIAYPDRPEDRNIYTDLMQEMKNKGNNVYVVTSKERKYKKSTQISLENGINVLRVKTGNLQKTNLIEKGTSILLIEKQFINAIRKYLKNIKFDLLIYSTPPITFAKVVRYIKKRDNANSYLLLKDIFPQNAVDIGLFKKNGIINKFFRRKEVNLYKISDFIGCMSQANVDYILKHNTFINTKNIEVCPNSINPIQIKNDDERNKDIRYRFQINENAFTFVYGGNLGKPQGIDFLIDIIDSNKKREDVFFLIIGSGTEYSKINQYINLSNLKNVRLYPYLLKDDYDQLLQVCDVGMIFLDRRFTIPNFPSRILTYMEFSIPVIAATDLCTDLRIIIEKNKFGFWSESGNLDEFNKNLQLFCNEDLIKQMGKNARQYLEENYTVSKSYETIMRHFIIGGGNIV
jgi:glycosyltransferase involved in cell wall biosynthesis